MSEQKNLTDAEKIELLISALKTNKKQFSIDLEYKSHQSIYFVAQGINRISEEMKNRILLKFPEVNPEFLENPGSGNPLKYNHLERPYKPVSLEDLISIPKRLDSIEKKLNEILEKLNSTS